jgi:hypothetical protein
LRRPAAPAALAAVPEGANLGLGCGNPVAIASLRPGQAVLDLGAGGPARGVGRGGARTAVGGGETRPRPAQRRLGGATFRSELEAILQEAGFTEVRIRPKANSDEVITSWESKRGFERQVFAAEVTAVKPVRGGGARCCA